MVLRFESISIYRDDSIAFGTEGKFELANGGPMFLDEIGDWLLKPNARSSWDGVRYS